MTTRPNIYPFKLILQQDLSLSIQYIKESISSIPDNGIGFGALRSKSKEISSLELPPILFNYLGRFNKASNDWQITTEPAGRAIIDDLSNILLNINGAVIDGQLGFYIDSRLGHPINNLFVERFEKNLKEIVLHCVEKVKQNKIIYTPSNFPHYKKYEGYNLTTKLNPIFIFPPGEGGAESYFNNLGQALSSEKTILFNNFYLYMLKEMLGKDSREAYSFEQLSVYYLSILRSVQPSGPYILVGWSFGGILAFEVAKNLIRQGDVVEKIILIDSYFSYKNIARAIIQEHEPELLELLQYNINMNYDPDRVSLEGTKLILFKSCRLSDEISKINNNEGYSKKFAKVNRLIESYYALSTEDNCIKDVYEGELKLINIAAGHFDWVKRKDIINIIAEEVLNSLIRPSAPELAP